MPLFLEKKLRAEAAKKGKTGKAADAYIYGAMNNMGAMRGSKVTAKGEKMEEKHEKKMGTDTKAEEKKEKYSGKGTRARLNTAATKTFFGSKYSK